MKKFLICTLFISSICHAQIEHIVSDKKIQIGVAKIGGSKVAWIYKTIRNYSFEFVSNRYSYITDVKVIKFEGSLDSLYDIFSQALQAKKGTEVEFKLGNELCSIETNRELGIIFLEFNTTYASVFIYKNQVDKLFGK